MMNQRIVLYGIIGLLDALPARRRAALVTALSVRGDRAALDPIMVCLKSDDTAVQHAAITAVSKLGDAEVVPSLLQTASVPSLRDQVVRVMAAMPGPAVDRELITSLETPSLREVAMQVLVTRGCTAAVPGLLALASNGEPDVRQQAWTSLAVLGTEDHLNAIMPSVLKIDNPADLSHAEAAIKKVFARARNKGACFRTAACYYDRAPDPIKGAILRMGSFVGDTYALDQERRALASDQNELAGAALRALAKWPNASAADDLLKQARDASRSADRIIALRGYIRIAGLETIKLSNAERMKILKTATALSRRDEETKQIINGLQQVTTLEALHMLEAYLDNPEGNNGH